jgi:hypothetical protein
MSWVDEEGVRLDPPDDYVIDPESDIRDTLAKFIVHLRAMGWSYRKIARLFNRNHETIRRIGQLTYSHSPRKPKRRGRKNTRKSRKVVDPPNEVIPPSP